MICDVTSFLLPSCAGSVHVVLSSISGIIFLIVGIIALFRDKNNILNQIACGFLGFPGGYQIFDAILVYYSASSTANLEILNFLRDISILFLIIGLAFGALVSLIIRYGVDAVLTKKFIFSGGVLVVVLLLGGIFGDAIIKEINPAESTQPGLFIASSTGEYAEPSRNMFGWIGITGSFILFTAIILYELVALIRETTEVVLKNKIIRLVIGLVLSISLIFLFDISFAFDIVRQGFIGIFVIHFLMHIGIIVGSLLVLSAFYNPQHIRTHEIETISQ